MTSKFHGLATVATLGSSRTSIVRSNGMSVTVVGGAAFVSAQYEMQTASAVA